MAILLSPESKDALNGLVNCLNETDRFSEALALLDEILIKEPENILCHPCKGCNASGFRREKDAAVALETIKRFGKLGTEDIARLGDMYHNLGLYDLSF